jgi:Ca-activated chloride channel family protein
MLQFTKQLLGVLVVSLLLGTSYSQEAQKTRILFIFDGSNSMHGQWQNSRKIEVAKRLMRETMDELKDIPNLEVALRVYGHQTAIRPGQQDCNDTKLEVPFGYDNFDKIKTKISSVDPKGTTPIARSLEYSAKDFPQCDNCRNVIILITDGIEACDEDPCAVAKMLREKGIEVRPYVIGIAMDMESLKDFRCIGKAYDALTEESFKSVMKVVLSEALNNTTLQVNLNNIKKQAKETDVTMSFYDQKSGELRYTFIHTLNEYNKPDTMTINPLATYRMVVHTTPQVEVKDIKLIPGQHNIVVADAPQGELELRILGAHNSYTDISYIVRKKGEKETINNKKMNSIDKYIVGTYDIEILSLPRIIFEGVKIEQSRIKSIEIQQSGVLDVNLPSFGHTAIFTMIKGERMWVCNLSNEKLSHQLNLQPGDYTIVFRPDRKSSSAYTVIKEFTITPSSNTNIGL